MIRGDRDGYESNLIIIVVNLLAARVAVASMAYNPYSEVVESLWNDYPDAQDEAVSRAKRSSRAGIYEPCANIAALLWRCHSRTYRQLQPAVRQVTSVHS